MYAIIGITGKVGGEIAKNLLSRGTAVRAVVRDAGKAEDWRARGCDIAVADVTDAAALTRAFAQTAGIFAMLPPIFDPAPGFPEARSAVAALKCALQNARVPKALCLSTIGAQSTRLNLLAQHSIMEKELGELALPITFLRPAWFMENSAGDVESARRDGVISSFLQPLDRPVPMIATADIGQLAAELLQQTWTGRRVVELEGPHRVSPLQLAAAFSRVLSKPVQAVAVPRDRWESLFGEHGMKNPLPRMQMLDGFNEGWIEFEGGEAKSKKGATSLDTVLRGLVGPQRD